MGIEDEVKEIKGSIKRDYQSMTLEKYKPLFDRVTKGAVEVMKTNNISKIELYYYCKKFLVIRDDGKFYHDKSGILNMEQLAEVYKNESVYNQSCYKRYPGSHGPPITRPSTEEALGHVILELNGKVKLTAAGIF